MIRKAGPQDAELLAGLAVRLWPAHTREELAEEFAACLEREDSRFFLLYCGREAAGFAQCALRRDYVEGTRSSPVGYLEGIFVAEGFRRRGFARELLAECQRWAGSRGCREFASDCGCGQAESARFHRAVGFAEANRIICFVKKL